MTDISLVKDHKTFLEQIPIKKRSKYRRNLLKLKQIKGQQPVFYQKEYPSNGIFNYQDFKLHYCYLEQSSHPEALIFFFHGMYFHGGTSGYLADIISTKVKNVNLYALDFKNSGFSDGDCPGYYKIKELQDQAIQFINFIEEKFKQKKQKTKIFVMGQSMGGMIAFKLCVKFPQKFDGAVLLAPALRDCAQNSPSMKIFGSVMGFLCPTFKFFPQDFKDSTKYQNFQYIKSIKGRYIDPHPPGTPYQLLKSLKKCDKDFSKMKTPYLCIQGGIDKSVDIFAPLDLQKQSISKDKTTIYFPDLWHVLLLEEQISKISPIIADWIKQRI